MDERRARRNETGRRAAREDEVGRARRDRTAQSGQDRTDRTGQHRADRTGRDEGGLGNVDRLSHAGPVVGETPAIYLAGMLCVRVR